MSAKPEKKNIDKLLESAKSLEKSIAQGVKPAEVKPPQKKR